ncbi:MAG: arylsulfatase A-like enzyme [Planctomycetota bacterium]
MCCTLAAERIRVYCAGFNRVIELLILIDLFFTWMEALMIRTLILLVLFVLIPSHSSRGSVKPPNILLLLADDVGVDQIEAYGLGGDPPTLPNIGKLVNEGVMFRNAWANPVCSSTRSTIMTGRYGFRTGMGFVVRPAFSMKPSELTLPEALDQQATGYSHAAIGKWHLSNDNFGGLAAPNVAGFDHYSGCLTNVAASNSSYFSWLHVENGTASPGTGYLTTRTVADAAEWIASAQEPWFSYVAFHAGHSPFHTPPAELFSVDLSQAGPPSSDPQPYFKAMLEAMDTEIGVLFERLAPYLSNTNIIFVGDNGTPTSVTVPPFLPSHAKATVYQGGVQVPLLISGPSVTQAGVECSALVSTVDIFSTVLELAGIEGAFGPVDPGVQPGVSTGMSADQYLSVLGVRLDGVSLVPYLSNPERPSIRQTVFVELFDPNGIGPKTKLLRAIRGERYKYLFHDPADPDAETDESPPELGVGTGSSEEEFYDLEMDPFELNDLLLQPVLTPAEQQAYEYLKREMNELLKS